MGRRKRTAPLRKRSRLWRWTKRVFVTVVVLVALSVIGAVVVLSNLDAPAVKTRIQAVVRDQVGLDVDYAHARFELGHIVLTDVVVRSPEEMRSIAPDLARARTASVTWSGLSHLDRVALSDVLLTIAVDEHGKTSFDAIGKQEPKKTEPKKPLSHRGEDIASAAPKLPDIAIDRASIAVVRKLGSGLDRTTVTGLNAQLHPARTKGKWHIHTNLGSATTPLDLAVVHAAADGHAKLWLDADATADDIALTIDVAPTKQSFASEVDVAHPVHAEGGLHFDPGAKKTRVRVVQATAGDGIADVKGALDIPDEGAPRIEHANGAIDLERLLALLPPGLVPLHLALATGRADFDVDNLALDRLPNLSEGAKVAIEANAKDLEIEEGKARSAHVSIHVEPSANEALHARADVTLDDAKRARVRGRNLDLHLDATQSKAGKLTGNATLEFDELETKGVRLRKGRLVTAVTDLDAKAETGKAVVDLDAGKSHLHVTANRAAKTLDYTLDGQLPELGPLQAFAPHGAGARNAKIRSAGRVEGTDTLTHHTTIDLEAPRFEPWVTARALSLTLDSHGTTLKHDAHGEIVAKGLHLAGTDPGDDDVKFEVGFDRRAKTLAVKLDATGLAEAKLEAKLAVKPDNAVQYDVDVAIAKVEPLAQYFLPGLDLAKLEVAAKGHGIVTGVVGSPAPEKTAMVDGNLDLRAKNVAFDSPELAFSIPEATIDSVLRPDGDKRHVESKIAVKNAKVSNPWHTFSVAELHDDATFGISGDLSEPEITSAQKLTIAELKQDLLPMYVVGDATIDVTARRSKDGVIHVADLELENGKGGTQLSVHGAIDPNLPRRLSLVGGLRQDLAKLSNDPKLLSARGTADVALRVESPDLAVFRTNADLRFANADIHVPHESIHIERADGQVPITAALRFDRNGATLLRENDNPYAALRFADQHPLQNRTSFISVRKASLPRNIAIESLIGNFQVVNNIFTLRQFEMGYRGGRVTGSAALDWNEDKSVLDLRIRADHVQSSHGEPLTGSASVIVTAADHNIEGRADILKIGSRHLLDVFDLQDPYHTDPAINRIRTALKFGYPDKVRVAFQRGFANAHIELGGLAWLFSVDDLKGIPVGPAIDRYLGPIFPVKVEAKR